MSIQSRLLSVILSLGLVACGGFGRVPTGITTHDFGPPSTLHFAPKVPLRVVEVRAPSWLGSSAMQYRFASERDQRRLVYTENRWAAAPSELIEAALNRALSPVRPQGGGCLLRVDLDEFSQIFDTPTQSHALLEARARLVSPRGDAVLAEERLRYQVAAAEPNAGAGATALRDASLQLAQGIDRWLAGLDHSSGGPLNIDVHCR